MDNCVRIYGNRDPMGINEWAKEIHQNAVEHGFWDEEPSFAEVVALCHSELSEALEADRNDIGIINMIDGKPEGKAVELVDCMMRILDWLAAQNVNVQDVLETKHAYNKTRTYKHGKKY